MRKKGRRGRGRGRGRGRVMGKFVRGNVSSSRPHLLVGGTRDEGGREGGSGKGMKEYGVFENPPG